MITKPKAKKFRIRRSGSLTSFGATGAAAASADAEEDETPAAEARAAAGAAPSRQTPPASASAARAVQPRPRPVAATPASEAPAAPLPAEPLAGEVSGPADLAAEEEIDAIRREGLTGRQLRTARRVAQRNGIAATSDFDAVRLLRHAGIDPFQRANMLELVVSETQNLPATTRPDSLPQTVSPPSLPSTETVAEDDRLREIARIQTDLARRRRRRSMLLVARLAFFVLLPTFLAGYYYYVIATPFYSAHAAFVINKAETGSAGAIGGLFSGTQFANSQDSITAQAFLESRDAMERLNKDLNFKQLYASDAIDPLQRLPSPPTDEAAYRIYKRNVKVGYDPSEGIINLEVTAPNPALAVKMAKALISYSEEQVDHMTLRMRDDQMKGARDSYDDAEAKLNAANQRVVALQTKFKVLSGDVEVSLLTSQITALQSQETAAELELQQLQEQPNPTMARIVPLKQRIDNIKGQIKGLRAKMTVNDSDGESLAAIQSQLLAAQADVQTRQLMLSQALQALESARITANQQTRYLSVGVQPVAADEPSSPQAFEDTVVAFLIFAGLYLMLSMTASILREQVSA